MSLVRLLDERAEQAPDQVGFTVLDRRGEDVARASYGALARRARAIAALLQERIVPGERVLVMTPPTLDFVAGFFAALCAGAIAVPAYPMLKPADVARVENIVRDAGIRVALASRELVALTKMLAGEHSILATVVWLTVDDGDPTGYRHPELADDALAFLQYTSGSTGTPKGVAISHSNALANQKAIAAAFAHDPARSVMASWLPLYHDMGLGSILQSLYLGTPLYLMSPLDFLQRPALWLETISRYRVTTSGGPCFAYDLCVRRIPEAERARLDLSCWDLAFNGAEPIRAEALDRFVDAFARSGFRREAFYPCYGLAESVLFVSGGDKKASPIRTTIDRAALERGTVADADGGRVVVGCGHTWPEHGVAIVDEARRVELGDNEVGEIWVRGPSIARGYWNDAERTHATFEAYLIDGRGPFLRTGDLGFVRAGELYVTGRVKDIIIIRGRNLYAEDIERTAEHGHASLRPGCGAAFGIDADGEERLVVVHELRDPASTDRDDIVRGVRERVTRDHGVQVHALVLVPPNTVPKTSSGKVQRSACRTRFLEGRLPELAP